MVISGVSIYAVSPDSDKRSEDAIAEDETPKGVKKIKDLGVFTITTVFSIIAYLWLFYVLMDKIVEVWEAGVTIGFFVLLLIMAFSADKYNEKKMKKRNEKKYGFSKIAVEGAPAQNQSYNALDNKEGMTDFTAGEVYNVLLKEKIDAKSLTI